MRSVEEALADILSVVPAAGAETVGLLQALGRALAEDVVGERVLPPWDNSEMDGYAVRAADTAAAPVELPIQGEVAAGHMPGEALRPGHAYRIFTGAPLPPGADAVVKQEDVAVEGGAVHIAAPVRQGQSVRPRGSDVSHGEVVLRRGAIVGPGEIGLCAALGRTELAVRRRAVVAILSTGDELVEADRPPGPGQIVNSNAAALAAMVQEAGGVPVRLGIAADRKEAIAARLLEARGADVVLTTGGVSVGDHDHVRDVLAALGCEMRFWRVNIKPGKPLAFGLWDGRPVFGLPGNPVSSMVTFELFVRPALRGMMGRSPEERPHARARLLEPVSKEEGRRHYLRGIVSRQGADLVARAVRKQSSGQLTSMVGVNALLVVREESQGVAAGEEIEVLLLGEPA
jgi:molybdopterin molybdotransferase